MGPARQGDTKEGAVRRHRGTYDPFFQMGMRSYMYQQRLGSQAFTPSFVLRAKWRCYELDDAGVTHVTHTLRPVHQHLCTGCINTRAHLPAHFSRHRT